MEHAGFIVLVSLIVAFVAWRNDNMVIAIMAVMLVGYIFYSQKTGNTVTAGMQETGKEFDKFVGNDKYHKNQEKAAEQLKKKEKQVNKPYKPVR